MIRHATSCTAAVLVTAMAASTSFAQGFDSGSDGSYGEIYVPSGSTLTLDMAPDGVFHATSVTVEASATLRFNRNALNTPVYLLATEAILVWGTIEVNGNAGTSNPPVGGAGGPGGFGGGMPGFGDIGPGPGRGPGASCEGDTSDGSTGAGMADYGPCSNCTGDRDGSPYGSPLLVPLVGGSGGGGVTGQPGKGGGGGGAILLSSNTRVYVQSPGIISAQGKGGFDHDTGGGSGGAIRIVSPLVDGNGQINVYGSHSTNNPGRIRVDVIDRSALLYNFAPLNSTSVGTFMAVFTEDLPKLDIIEAAGEVIPEGTPEPVRIILPFGSETMRTVTVQARNFTGIVPIALVLTPDSGEKIVIETEIDMGTGDPATVEVDVDLPVNTLIDVRAWTR